MTAHTQADTTGAERPAGSASPDHSGQIVPMAVATGLLIVFLFLLPALFRAHYELLLWSEGFSERAYGQSFVTGQLQKLIETPKPLWSLFWLLSESPNQLFVPIVLLIGTFFLMFQLLVRRITGSIWAGIVGGLLLIFSAKDLLDLALNGSWIVPYLLLGLLFVYALYARRWNWATAAIGLAGLIRPESWLLAVFLLIYVRRQKEALKPHYFLPLLAPLLWLGYDLRISRDALYTYRSTAAYAILSGIPATTFLSFWGELIPGIVRTTGLLVFVLGIAGIFFRARNIARAAKDAKFWAVVLDPLFMVTILPFVAAWLMSLSGNIIIMSRFFFLSIALIILYAVLLPYELFRHQATANRGLIISAALILLVISGAARYPVIGRELHRSLKVTESKVAGVAAVCTVLEQSSIDFNNYRTVMIPMRRYAMFSHFCTPDIINKFVSYREVSLAVGSTQHMMRGYQPIVPRASPGWLRELIESGYSFGSFLPALCIWIPDDESRYIDAFAFDDPQYFRKNYIDENNYAFRIIGQALDSLALIYDVREVPPELLQPIAPAEPEGPFEFGKP